ncbi:hypothetical protein PoB_003866400 [Plakobranchus ocellatus]|uniref:Uncharacterized protein n=1 Tax=Plakobranchus ocellatus TaxID=259542 RepID=A0AAV4B0F3_9GAST|nr:hypothetical protein PoB_003866400 [Plakobranchus ocellatus]
MQYHENYLLLLQLESLQNLLKTCKSLYFAALISKARRYSWFGCPAEIAAARISASETRCVVQEVLLFHLNDLKWRGIPPGSTKL